MATLDFSLRLWTERLCDKTSKIEIVMLHGFEIGQRRRLK